VYIKYYKTTKNRFTMQFTVGLLLLGLLFYVAFAQSWREEDED